MEAIKQTFFQECEEQLAELETGLLTIDSGDCGSDVVNAVFRAVHSIKGGAGAFALENLVCFAHVFETALDALRAQRINADSVTVKVFLRAADLLADLVREARSGDLTDPARSAALGAELAALTSQSAEPVSDWDALLAFEPVRIGGTPDNTPAASPVTTDTWQIHFRPRTSLYTNGNDPLVLLRELARIGATSTTLDLSHLPDFDDLEPEMAHLAWVVTLSTDRTEQDIREVFEFVDTDCELEIESVPTTQQEPAGAAGGTEDVCLVSVAVQAAAAEPSIEELIAKFALPVAKPIEPHANIHHVAVPLPTPEAVKRAEVPAPRATIRVDLDRLDRLIDLVGELVINQAVIAQRVTESGINRSSSVSVGLEELEHLTHEIQDSVMAIRAQPVKAVFQRLPRLAREVAAQTGKEVKLVTEGESTEVDNTVIERLADPLTHMIRNAIDHGIEAPEQRRAAGKPAEGTVRVSALHRSGRIVIEVTDDGAGINRQRVLASAVSKGIVAANVSMSDDEIDNLIFAPGFSTAAAVSDISGRGVGMDVVRRSIQALGGRISITSEFGRGSRFSLSLPLTLAVLDGMVVGVEDDRFVVPLTAILETFQLSSVCVHQLGDGLQVASIRGSYVPLIDVGIALGFRTEMQDPAKVVALLVEGEGGTRAALVVDVIHGQRQVVIKSLEANYRHVPGVAAATILGDGRVALILDVATIVEGPGARNPAGEFADA